MNLPLVINNCNVCSVNGNRKQCRDFNTSDTVFVLPYEFSEAEEGLVRSYGMTIRERFCENGSEEICSTYLIFLIQSKNIKKIVATPEYIMSHFGDEIEEGEIGNIFGIKFISTRNFLSEKVKAEISK